jgi:hypothetical protein
MVNKNKHENVHNVENVNFSLHNMPATAEVTFFISMLENTAINNLDIISTQA